MARKPSLPWYQKAAQIMVREGKTLFQAVVALEIPSITSYECGNIERTKAFDEVLWSERHRYHKELASDPNLSKKTLVGELMVCIKHLMDDGEWAKAAEAILKLARVEGYLNDKQEVNVFAGLTAKDFAELERTLSEPKAGRSKGGVSETGDPSGSGPSSSVN